MNGIEPEEGGLAGGAEEQSYAFAAFARHPFYREVNARLVAMTGVCPGQRVVDLACGPGSVTRLIVDKIHGARESFVVGIDMSAGALRQAREEFRNVRDAVVQFVEARAEEVSSVVHEAVDAVILCNAIHLIEDKQRLLREVARSLKPGGVFAFNTAFYQGAVPPQSEQFYRRWMWKALRILKGKYGLSPEKAERTMARRPLTREGYEELLKETGFAIKAEEVREVPMTLGGYQDISSFRDFIEGTLPGVPLDRASAALRAAAAEVFGELGVNVVPRYWLCVVAVRA